MTKYVSVVRRKSSFADLEEYYDTASNITVYERERPETEPTGLLDADGNELHRVNEPRHIGFWVKS
jgi:hypothetical protein